MMKKIKFRAWDKQLEEFMDIGRLYQEDDVYCVEEHPDVGDAYGFVGGKDGVVLMQYTGLVDKNGTEIYEGDVINKGTHKYRTKEKQIIHYDVKKGRYIQLPIQFLDNPRQIDRDYGDGVTAEKMKKVEVIGNIYEHPHLLGD